MVGDLVKLLNSLNVSSDNGFVFFENSDSSVNFDVGELFIFEFLESCWDFVFLFLVEDDSESSGIIVDLKNSSHWLFEALNHSADDYDVVDWLSVDFANVVCSWAWVLNHFHRDWREKSVFAALPSIITWVLTVALSVVVLFESSSWAEAATAESFAFWELKRKNKLDLQQEIKNCQEKLSTKNCG